MNIQIKSQRHIFVLLVFACFCVSFVCSHSFFDFSIIFLNNAYVDTSTTVGIPKIQEKRKRGKNLKSIKCKGKK